MNKMMMFVKSFRVNAQKSDSERDFGLTIPDDIECVFDVQYMGEDEWNRLDIYKPLGAAEKLPVIINCHGGGWVYGDKRLYQFYCMSLAQRGFAVVNFSYHLAPEYDFYTQLNEVNEVVKFTLDNSQKYGFDKDNVFIVGDSAGATMAGNYTNICTNGEYAARFDFSVPYGFVPRAVLLNCGMFSAEDGSDEPFEALFGKDFKEKLDDIDVINNATTSFPPCFIATAPDDFLKKSCYKFHKRLLQLGTEVKFKDYAFDEKLLGHCFHVDMKSSYAHICNDEECAFLRQHMI